MWLFLQDRVWTSARLQLRGWKNNYFCAICERNLETATHLFIECPYARKVWTLIAEWSNCANLEPTVWTEHRDMEDWFMAMTAGGNKEATEHRDMEDWFMAMTVGGNKEAHSLAILTV
jgi:hypothetical protein